MSLNIKNPETYRLVRELAELTGESMTEAVTVAVEQRLEKVRHERDHGLIERVRAIVRDTAPRFKEPYRSTPHGDWLYDEHGLPK